MVQLMMIICTFLGTALLRMIILQTGNKKRVLIYYKNFLTIKLIALEYLHKFLNFKLRIRGKVRKILYFFRLSSQNKYDFKTCLESLELHFD